MADTDHTGDLLTLSETIEMKFTKAASLGSAFQEKKNVVHLVNGWQKSMHKEMRAGLS